MIMWSSDRYFPAECEQSLGPLEQRNILVRADQHGRDLIVSARITSNRLAAWIYCP
jgi:hypothetical protein